VEAATGKRLYCEDIKNFWVFVGELHRKQTNHFSKADVDKDGNWYCLRCGKPIDIGPNTARQWMAEKDAPKAKILTNRYHNPVDPVPGPDERF